MNEITGLFITGCKDNSLWYAGKVGEIVDFYGYCCVEKKYRSRGDGGLMNWVNVEDCNIVDTSLEALQIAAQEIINDLNNDGEINGNYRSVKDLEKALQCIK